MTAHETVLTLPGLLKDPLYADIEMVRLSPAMFVSCRSDRHLEREKLNAAERCE